MNLEYYVDSANAMYGEYGATEKADGKICEYIFEDCFIEVKVNSEEKKMIEVPYFSQEGILPNGCEATSAAMLLNFYGVKVSPEEFVDNYLDCESVSIRWGCRYGPNPKNAYAGDPRSKDKGWGCFSPAEGILREKRHRNVVQRFEKTVYRPRHSRVHMGHGAYGGDRPTSPMAVGGREGDISVSG